MVGKNKIRILVLHIQIDPFYFYWVILNGQLFEIVVFYISSFTQVFRCYFLILQVSLFLRLMYIISSVIMRVFLQFRNFFVKFTLFYAMHQRFGPTFPPLNCFKTKFIWQEKFHTAEKLQPIIKRFFGKQKNNSLIEGAPSFCCPSMSCNTIRFFALTS